MKRKTSTTPTRIWKYGLPFGPTDECRELVEKQFKLAQEYRRILLDIHLAARTRYRVARAQIIPGFDEIEKKAQDAKDEVEKLRDGIKQIRAAARARAKPAAELLALKNAVQIRKEANAELTKARDLAKTDPGLCLSAEAISADKNEALKAAYNRFSGEKGLAWGTCLAIGEAVDRASKSHTDPEHKVLQRERITVQLQGGLRVQLDGSIKDTRLQMDVPGHKGRTVVRMRIGSDEKKKPIWATCKMVLHRPLPEDCVIKWAWIQREMVGTRYHWELCVQMESEKFFPKVRMPTHVCAINYGWRQRCEQHTDISQCSDNCPRYLRVAYVIGTDGYEEERVLPLPVRKAIEHADKIRSIRDLNFDKIRATLVESFKGQKLPEPIYRMTAGLAKWKSLAKLTLFAEIWRDHSFEGDETLFEAVFAELDAWRRQDRHLYQWEANERDKAYANRKEQYRLLATELARKYSTIRIHNFKLAPLVKRKKVEHKETEQEKAQRRNRTLAALSELGGAIKLAASNAGTTVEVVETDPKAPLTKQCHVCGGLCEFDAEKELEHRCEHCGGVWDQDQNFARNLLSRNLAEAAE